MPDVVPEELAEDRNPVVQLFERLRVTNQIGELHAEPVVIVAVFVHFALLIAVTAQIIDELLLSFVQAPADALT